ncbi:heparan sulfate 2-O-sulfotransferase 1-like [Limulus polyphemus]|uniref:Heparan sulfate 2-O-sulfotransferase 1-like n=1 Tax=Limulus polyphemus TaxID=6850 RepID=A0ABM1TD52_LIMPO|nr:heparan sulfate 2-O-sulfotransferase 1-like [Limulus polyphemus]
MRLFRLIKNTFIPGVFFFAVVLFFYDFGHLYPKDIQSNILIQTDRKSPSNRTRLENQVTKTNHLQEKKLKGYSANYVSTGIKETDPHILMYNRVPKSGSETMTMLISTLSHLNDFEHYRSSVFNKRQLSKDEQRAFVLEVMKHKPPFAYDRHIYFTNFFEFNYTNPIYINTMRDPVEKVISRFFFWRVPGIPVYEELKAAGKVNISKTEWLKKKWFARINSAEIKNKNSQKKVISEEVKKILKKNLTMEYEFYEFIRERLHEQFNRLRLKT